jgi:AcrR family transcriptional regulator
MRDAQATRRRILDAAAAEFAAHGIAGARVDRIAAAAKVNKAQMYAYHGSKDGLFDAVFNEQLVAIVDSVPLDASDLPGYAVALYDEYLARPELIRLATWARLERTPTGDLLGTFVGHDTSKLASITAAQADGHVDPALDPRDVYALVTAVSMTWSPASVLVAASADDDAAEHEARRALLADIVGRMFRPGGAAPSA